MKHDCASDLHRGKAIKSSQDKVLWICAEQWDGNMAEMIDWKYK